MTIRQYLKQRRFRLQMAMSPLLIAALAVEFLKDWIILTLGLCFTALAIMLIILPRTRCLKCSQPLGVAAILRRSKRNQEVYCPHCGVSFDEILDNSPKLSHK